jgi:RimK family alpha-L-glutamate ligase
MTVFVAGRPSPTNVLLRDACEAIGLEAALLPADDVLRSAGRGDVVLSRLDVLPTLDGVEPGLVRLGELAQRGVRLLNPPHAVLGAHDKLQTAIRLARAGVPHPRTAYVDADGHLPDLGFPVVVKPRFGSWGRDVTRCESAAELRERLRELESRRWFRRHGALVQELVPSRGYDLRVVVAGGRVVGAIRRTAAPGEWRTNVALGGERTRVSPPPDAELVALAAAAAIGLDLGGIDLLPTAGGHVVIEANGCVDFTDLYALDGEDVFWTAMRCALGLAEPAVADEPLAALA